MARKRKLCEEDTGQPKKKLKIDPKKRNDKASVNDEDEDEDEPDNFKTIKCGFGSIIKKRYRKIVMQIFFEKSFEMTKTSALASLLLLYKVNKAVDANDEDFFNQNGSKLIRDSFDQVLMENIDNRKKSQMPSEFRQWVYQVSSRNREI